MASSFETVRVEAAGAAGAVGAVRETDILVVGGGLAGLAAAILTAQAGFSVVVVDRAPLSAAAGRRDDLRTTALLEPALAVLRQARVWERLESRAAPLSAMRMIDAGGRENRARFKGAFDAADLDRAAFGANVANGDLHAALAATAEETPGITIIAPAHLERVTLRADAALARLGDGALISARLVIGADGRESAVRAAAGLRARRLDYGQTALVFTVSHPEPHGSVSTEILREGGPFTLVPFTPDEDGRPRSSVVWMERRAKAARLMAMEESAFLTAAQERSLGLLGPLAMASKRAAWPVISLLADRFHSRRAALIAEAAHVAPPIGAQGLNMSLKDAETLAQLLVEARREQRDIGSDAVLAGLTRARYADVAMRIAATAALNGAAIGAARPIRDLRRAGLALIHGTAPLRQAAMRFGLG
ncbi:MAG: FAD-dependent monooxygenase [Pseudomonadota bacterium]